VLEGAEISSLLRFDVPDNYLLQTRVQLDPQAAFTLAFRVPSEADTGYRLTIAPGGNEAEIAGPGFRYARHVKIDTSRPITITAFVQGSIIEFFLDDTYAFSCRAYTWSRGALGLGVKGGKVQEFDLTVKTCEENRP
jgi:hypothetical protein